LASATAVIAAAGSGERLGAGGPKALVDVGGRPLLAGSLLAFDAAESIGKIVVAAPPGAERDVREIAAIAGVKVEVVPGGEHRSQSVANAIQKVDTEMVVVHDAARPLVNAELIDQVVRRLHANEDMSGVIAAAPATDTIKEASVSRRVVRTLDRSRIWAVQTPQAFRTEPLRQAVADADEEDIRTATDDATLVERIGGDVLIHEAADENVKVTTPLDRQVVELLLAARRD